MTRDARERAPRGASRWRSSWSRYRPRSPLSTAGSRPPAPLCDGRARARRSRRLDRLRVPPGAGHRRRRQAGLLVAAIAEAGAPSSPARARRARAEESDVRPGARDDRSDDRGGDGAGERRPAALARARSRRLDLAARGGGAAGRRGAAGRAGRARATRRGRARGRTRPPSNAGSTSGSAPGRTTSTAPSRRSARSSNASSSASVS